jgi:hypothetical protein
MALQATPHLAPTLRRRQKNVNLNMAHIADFLYSINVMRIQSSTSICQYAKSTFGDPNSIAIAIKKYISLEKI